MKTKRGTGYVYQRPGRPVWLAQYFLDGRRIRARRGSSPSKTDRLDAEKLATLLRAIWGRGGHADFACLLGVTVYNGYCECYYSKPLAAGILLVGGRSRTLRARHEHFARSTDQPDRATGLRVWRQPTPMKMNQHTDTDASERRPYLQHGSG